MPFYIWKFNVIPDSREVENFIESQMPLFARNARHLTGADGQPVVDLMRVEHNCGAINLEFQLNGVEGQSGDVFCFPGYYPGDMDEAGNALFNCCDTGENYYGKVVEAVLSRARKVFDLEVVTDVEKQWQFHQTA
jgi:hypothetical protein